jgi:hypothetical protein
MADVLVVNVGLKVVYQFNNTLNCIAQPGATFHVVRAGSRKFNTRSDEWISVQFYVCLFLYNMCNENIRKIIGKMCKKKMQFTT